MDEAQIDGGILSGDVGQSNLDDNFEQARSVYRVSIRRCYEANPDLHGKMIRPKDINGNPFNNYIPMSFSHTLIDLAGGMRSLRKWWEPEV